MSGPSCGDDAAAEIKELKRENARLRDRLKELSLDVLGFWKTVFGVDYVHTLPGETPGELALRAAEHIKALVKDAQRTPDE